MALVIRLPPILPYPIIPLTLERLSVIALWSWLLYVYYYLKLGFGHFFFFFFCLDFAVALLLMPSLFLLSLLTVTIGLLSKTSTYCAIPLLRILLRLSSAC